MRTLDLAALHIFKTVVEEGGITRAAAKLHRVQSNVTTRVKQLEQRLGAKLFLRHSRKLVLSPEGKLLLGYADRLLRLSSEAEAMLQDGMPRGTLKIGTMESTAAVRLPPILSAYHRAYPEVRIELVTATTGVLLAKVIAHEVDAAFAAGPLPANDLAFQPVFREKLVLITPRSFPKIRAPRDIRGRTVIAFGAGCTYRQCLEDWLARARVIPERVMEFNSYHTIVACVSAGAGIAIVPRSVLDAVPGGNDVAVCALPAAVANAHTLLVWHPGHTSAAFAALRKQLRKA